MSEHAKTIEPKIRRQDWPRVKTYSHRLDWTKLALEVLTWEKKRK
jgi:hypothetical protein